MGEEAELGEKVKENKGEGLYAAEMEDIGLSFFFINQTDLCDSEFQLCFLLSVPCSSKCLFPNTSLFFLGYENYFSSYGWREDSIEVYPEILLISVWFRYSHE